MVIISTAVMITMMNISGNYQVMMFVLIFHHYMFVYIVKSVNNTLFLYYLFYGHGLFILFLFQ